MTTELSWDNFMIRLSPASGEKERDALYQEGLRPIAKAVTPEFHQRAITFDSVDAHGYPIGEWASALKPAVVLSVWASERVIKLLIEWIKAKNGRKIRVKLGDISVETTSPSEVEKIFESLKKHEILPNHPEDSEHS